MMSTYQEYLTKIWYDAKHPAGFAGPEALYKVIQKENKFKIGKHRIKRWLQNQDSYSVRRQLRRKLKSQKILVNGVNYMWDTDLADVSNLKSDNEGYIFLLVIIDAFSRKAWVTPLKDKKASSVIKAFKPIIEKEKPVIIRSDRGSEFKNKFFAKFCKENSIVHVGSLSNSKASFAESFIGKFKKIMYTYFESKLTYKYLDVLQDFVNAYNKRPHSSLYGMSPNEINEDTQYIIWQRMYAKPNKKKHKRIKYKYKIGQKVRLTYLKRPFDRGYEQKWTEEFFIVSHRYLRNGIPVYKVTDYSSEPIVGTFYTAELQAIDKDDQSLYKIEKILKRRTVKGQKQILVHWLGWPSKHDSWLLDTPAE